MKTNYAATINKENPEKIAENTYNVNEFIKILISDSDMTKKHIHEVFKARESGTFKKAANEIRKDYNDFIIKSNATDFEICIGFIGAMYTLAYTVNPKAMVA